MTAAAIAFAGLAGGVIGYALGPVIDHVLTRRGGGALGPVQRGVVTVLSALLVAATAWRIGWSWDLPAYLLLVLFLVVLSFVDMRTKTLPRQIVYAAGFAGVALLTLAAAFIGEPERIVWAALGALAGCAVLWMLHALTRGGLGFGDVRLGAVLGWYLAWRGLRFVPVAIFLAFFLSALVGVVLLISGLAGRRTAVPFGPFLAAGALIVLVGGPALVDGMWPS